MIDLPYDEDSQRTTSPQRFGAIPGEEMNEAQKAAVAAILDGPRGNLNGLLGPFDALLHSPGLADSVQRVGAHVRFRTSLPLHLNEMAILLVARRWGAQFEFYSHRPLATKAGLGESEIEAIRRGERPVSLESDAAAVYDFVVQLLSEGDVTDDAFAAVADRWGKQGVIDLIGAVGYYTMVSFILNVDHYPCPDGEEPLP